jgi:hypothetical protein
MHGHDSVSIYVCKKQAVAFCSKYVPTLWATKSTELATSEHGCSGASMLVTTLESERICIVSVLSGIEPTVAEDMTLRAR